MRRFYVVAPRGSLMPNKSERKKEKIVLAGCTINSPQGSNRREGRERGGGGNKIEH